MLMKQPIKQQFEKNIDVRETRYKEIKEKDVKNGTIV